MYKDRGCILGQSKNQNYTCIYSCVTYAIHPCSVVCVVWDLTCDWLLHNKHSRHILGVHGFVSLTVISISLKNVSCGLRIHYWETLLEPLTSKLLVVFLSYVVLTYRSHNQIVQHKRLSIVYSHHSSPLGKEA